MNLQGVKDLQFIQILIIKEFSPWGNKYKLYLL